MKTKHPDDIMVFGMFKSDGYVISPFIFPHGLQLDMETHIGSTAALDWEGGCKKTLCLATGELSIGC